MRSIPFSEIIAFLKKPMAVLMIFTVIGNVVSFGKNIIVAYYFGTNVEYDVFLMALFIPILLSGLFMGPLQGALIPIIISSKVKYGEEESLRIYKSISLLMIGFVAVLSLLYISMSKLTLKVLPYGFDDQYFGLLVSLSNVLILTLFTNCVIILLKNLYNAKNNFILPCISALFGALISILSIYLDPVKDVYTLCYSLLIGSIVDILIQAVCLHKAQIRLPRGFNIFNAETKRALLLTVPLLISATMGHANPLIGQIMASHLYEGAVSSLNYADKLNSLLVQIFVLTISATTLRSFSQLIADNEIQQLKNKVNNIISVYALILLPITVLIIHFSPFIVKLLFERGAFTTQSTRYTSTAWAIYSIGLYFNLCGTILARVYNAIQDARDQMFVSLIGLILNVGLNFGLMKIYGHNGIVMGTVITGFVTMSMLYYFLTRRLGRIIERRTVHFLARVAASNLSLSLIVYLLKGWMVPTENMELFIWLTAVVGLSFVGLFVLYRLFRVDIKLVAGAILGGKVKEHA